MTEITSPKTLPPAPIRRAPHPAAGYRLESSAAAEDVLEALAERFRIVPDEPSDDGMTYYDTFDWRLYRAGLTLTAREAGGRLVLDIVGVDGREKGRAIATAEPGLIGDLPAGVLRDRLASVIDMRRLLPVVALRESDRRARIVDDLEKTVVRVALRTGTAEVGDARGDIPPLILLFPVRGYDRELGRVREYLEDQAGLPRTGQASLVAALEAVGRTPGDYTGKFDLRLDANARADEAARAIHRTLLDTIRRNEAGTAADTDSEFLHDLRVAVRRTRSALSQIRDVFPAADTQKFKAGFRRVGQVTGPTRDLDVYLLKLPAYAESLPEGARGDLEALREFLVRTQKEEQAKVAVALGSDWYRDLLADWRDFLTSTSPTGPAPANASRPIGLVASESIRSTFRKLIKQGRKIDAESPAERLHRLRITAKKLRYLLTFFRSLYPADSIDLLVKALKKLQDNLGDFNDYGVQQAALKGFAVRMLEDGAPVATIMAMGRLVERLEGGEAEERRAFEQRFAAFSSSENRRLFKRLFGGKGGAE